MKMYVREFLQPRGIFVAVANNITSYQLCCSRANKIFFIFFSHGAARIFSKKEETFSHWGGSLLLFFWKETENYSQYLFFHGRRRYVLTIVIMAKLTCIVCVFAPISHSLCMQHDWCSYVEVTVSYETRDVLHIHSKSQKVMAWEERSVTIEINWKVSDSDVWWNVCSMRRNLAIFSSLS